MPTNLYCLDKEQVLKRQMLYPEANDGVLSLEGDIIVIRQLKYIKLGLS